MRLRHEPPPWVADYIGIPFKPKGRTRDGVDCWGGVRLVYQDRRGVSLPSHDTEYERVDDTAAAAKIVEDEIQRRKHWRTQDTPEVLDVARFFMGKHLGWHVGLVIAHNQFLHWREGVDGAVERLDSPVWEPRLRGFFRFSGPILVHARTAPLTAEPISREVPSGSTIAEMLALAGVEAHPWLNVSIAGVLVPPPSWQHVRPKPGAIITVAAMPAGTGGGGDSRKGMRTIAMLAVVAAAAAAPAALMGSAWVAGHVLGASLISTGVGIAGSLAVSALIPPARRRGSSGLEGSGLAISGTRNELRENDPIPVPLGKFRYAPPYASQARTEIVGDDQYVRMLFLQGYGRLAISELKIGDTAIGEFDGVEYEVLDGSPGQAGSTLFAGVVLEDTLSVELDHAGNPVTRTSPAGADELSVDITFPDGVGRQTREGDIVPATVRFDIEYAPTGTSSWSTVNGASPDFSRGLAFLFRTPDVIAGGEGQHTGDLAWGFPSTAPVPSYLPITGSFSWELTGYFYTNGLLIGGGTLYDFGIDCSDAGELMIGGQIVASWYGTHASAGGASPDYTAHTGSIRLRRGWHSFRVRMESRSGSPRIAVGMRESGGGAFVTLSASQIAGTRMGQAIPSGTQHPSYRWFDTRLYSGSLSVTASQSGLLRRNVTWAVPRGQYDVRIRRAFPLGGDNQDDILDEAFWTSLRSIRNDSPVKKDGLALVAMRIKASDQLNGVVDNFNCVVQTVCPDYDVATGEWIERATSNPASLYRYVLQHPGNKRPLPDESINLDELASLHDRCRTLGLEYNGVLADRLTVFDACQEVLAAGRASPAFRDGKYTAVWDRVQTTPRQLFTPRNTYGYAVRRIFPDPPHALRVRFTNAEKGYVPDERVVLDDGYAVVDEDGVARDAFGNAAPALPLATKFDDLSLAGVVTGTEAFKHGRYYLAVARLRPEEHVFSTDFEHLATTRGDMILLAHDVPRLGLSWGRIVQVIPDSAGNIAGVDLDQEITMDAGDTYRLVVRVWDGSIIARQVVTVEGVSHRVMFQSPFPASGILPEVKDLCAFGRVGHETRELVIKSIAMNGLHATLTCVDHAPAVHDADQGPIPPWDPDISLPPAYQQGPETPVIEQIRSDDYVMIRAADGTLLPRMVIYLRPPSSTRPLATEAQVRLRPVDESTHEPLGAYQSRPRTPIDANSVSVPDVTEGVTYQLRLRTIAPNGMVSPWVEAFHTVIGKRNPPPDLLAFEVSRLSDGTRRYTWDIGAAPPDIAGVVIRYGDTSDDWDTMDPLHEGVLEASPSELNVPAAGLWKFGAKAIDTSGNLSRNAIYTTVTLGQPRLEGVAFSSDEYLAGWLGTKTNCFVNDSQHLECIDDSTWDGLASIGVTSWDSWPRWNMQPRVPLIYESAPLDAGFLYHFSPDAVIEAEGDARVEVAWSTDAVTYTAWQSLADVRETAILARAMKVRVTVYTLPGFPVPLLRGCLVLMRAPEVIDFLDNLTTSSLQPASLILGVGDVRLPVQAGRFQQIRSVSLTFNGVGAGYSWELVDRDVVAGPRVRIYNADDLPTHALIDATIRGIA